MIILTMISFAIIITIIIIVDILIMNITIYFSASLVFWDPILCCF